MIPEKPALETFTGIRASFSAHDFSAEELMELVDPKLGIITGFADLMADLETLRRMDLGSTPPALGIAGEDPEA